MTKRFDPFTDRLSRDIRNDLSESLTDVLSSRSLEPALMVAERYRRHHPAPLYHDYINNRLNAYRRTLDRLAEKNVSALLPTAAVLWDLGLFFEVHEILEPAWMSATGDQKLLLQALIRAAGVYVYLEAGYPQRAAKIAGKAVPVLQCLQAAAADSLDMGALINALRELRTEPPRIARDNP
ncbi:MAG: DUF309 domain-containing protein [Desulfofustis sp.]|jgi:hypothetical protein|nr:DUF309 domain-containing protein [Desulfofustis sp.]